MQRITIYVKNGVYSTAFIDGYEETQTRLIANEGKLLTNGVTVAKSIDLPNDQIGLWSEINDMKTILQQLEELQ